MKVLCDFYGSTIGKKVIVAVTGVALFLFLIGHMLGNLKTFAGFDPVLGMYKLDLYAVFLREIGEKMMGNGNFLWGARIGLLVCLLLHVVCVLQLRARNMAARPVGYKKQVLSASSVAAATMWWTGPLILIYVIYHILHFTTGDLHFGGFQHGAVYANVYQAFSVWYITAIYVAAMAALAFHLYHGVWSLFQTLGLDSPDRNNLLRAFAKVVAVVLFLGFVSVPAAIYSGALPEPIKTTSGAALH